MDWNFMYLHIFKEVAYSKSDSIETYFMIQTIEIQKRILHILLNFNDFFILKDFKHINGYYVNNLLKKNVRWMKIVN